MAQRHLLFAASSLALGVLLAAGCGGKNGSGFTPVDGANAQTAGDTIGSDAESSAGGFENPAGTGAASDCVSGTETLTPATLADGDQDGVPDTLTVTFDNCLMVDTAGNVQKTFNGTASLVDSTPATADADFVSSLDVTIDIVAGQNGNATGTITMTGSRSATGTSPGSSSFTMTDTTNTAAEQHTPEPHSGHDNKSWTVTYTPGTAWNFGTPLVAGTFQISGTSSMAVDGQGADMALASANLMVDPACSTHIVSGTLTGTYAASGGQTATVVVTWNGCGNRTVTYNGP